MKSADEKKMFELGALIGQINHARDIQFLNFSLQGADAKDTSPESIASHVTAAAMDVGLTQRERELAIICHDELCKKIGGGMGLRNAITSARINEPGRSAFNALTESFLDKLEAAE